MQSHEVENNMDIEAKWFELEKARQDLLSGKALEAVGPEIFSTEKECACCMDERVGNREILGGQELGGRWNVAGSGILLPEKNWQDRAALAAKEAFARGVTKLTFHDGCGAAGLAVKQDLDQFSAEEKELYLKNSDLYGQRFVEVAQAELNKLNSGNEPAVHVGKAEVLPFEYHAAIGATVDSTGEFNAYRLSKDHPLKYSFNIDASSGTKNEKDFAAYYLNELLVAIRIATGHHGFGAKFDQEHPFAITLVGNHSDGFSSSEEKIKNFLSTAEPKALDLIKFVYLVKPEAKKKKKDSGRDFSETQVQL